MIKRILMILVFPPAMLVFWLSLFVIGRDKIDFVWQQIQDLKK